MKIQYKFNNFSNIEEHMMTDFDFMVTVTQKKTKETGMLYRHQYEKNIASRKKNDIFQKKMVYFSFRFDSKL